MILKYKTKTTKNQKYETTFYYEDNTIIRKTGDYKENVDDAVVKYNKKEYLKDKKEILEIFKNKNQKAKAFEKIKILSEITLGLFSISFIPILSSFLPSHAYLLYLIPAMSFSCMLGNIKSFRESKTKKENLEELIKEVNTTIENIETKECNSKSYIEQKDHITFVNIGKIIEDCDNQCNEYWYNLNQEACMQIITKKKKETTAIAELELLFRPVTTMNENTAKYVKQKYNDIKRIK